MSFNKTILGDKNIQYPSQLVPYELYYYFPKETDVFQESKYFKSNYKRLIFEGNNNYTLYELSKLLEFKNSSKLLQINLPNSWLKSDTLRFLYANNFSIRKTIKVITSYINKQSQYSFLLNPYPKLIDILNSGAFYISGRDLRFRPIIHFSIENLEKIKRYHAITDLVNSVIYLFEFVLKYLLLPGQIESWNIMVDVNNSLSDIGEELKQIISIFKSDYPSRLFKLFIVNVKGVNNLTWSFVKLLIEQVTLSKVFFIKEKEHRSYFDYINPSQLESKYGGLKEDLKNKYFPPDYSKDKVCSYLLSFEKTSNILLTPDEYDTKMANEGLFYSLPINYSINTQHIAVQSDIFSNRQSKFHSFIDC